MKGSRFITHLKRLRDVDAALGNFCASGVLALGAKLGPMLWQLPPNLPYDEELATAFLELLPRSTAEVAKLAERHDERLKPDRMLLDAPVDRPVRHAFEVRHPSWCERRPIEVLRAHDVALVVADSPGKWPYLEERTSDLRYVRLHGHTELYASGYSPRSLDAWAEKCRRWREGGEDVLVYFDNDARGRAPYDAVALLDRLAPAETGHLRGSAGGENPRS